MFIVFDVCVMLGIVFCVVLCSCEIGVKMVFVAFSSWCFCSGIAWSGCFHCCGYYDRSGVG